MYSGSVDMQGLLALGLGHVTPFIADQGEIVKA
jgi:hypothetical protein